MFTGFVEVDGEGESGSSRLSRVRDLSGGDWDVYLDLAGIAGLITCCNLWKNHPSGNQRGATT